MPLKKYLDYDGLDYLIQRIPRTKIRVTFDDVFAGETATCTLGTTTYTNTVPVTSPYQLVFSVVELGTWTIATSYLGDDYGTTVEVTGVGTTATGHVSYVSEIDGATVTPTDDITTWLKCANIEDPSITTLADVLANRSLFETLIANSNACKYMARSTTWVGNYSAKVPTMTGTTTPSGEVIAISQYSGATYYPWHAFDGNSSTIWCPASSGPGQWIGYIFPEKQTISKFRLAYSFDRTVPSVTVQASDDGTTWTDLDTITTSASSDAEYSFNNTNSYYRYRLVFNMAAGIIATISIIQFYGGVQGVTTSQDAMALVGKYDYCSNALLSNATWAEAIINSDYWESVCNYSVPKMTSNTAPEGECFSGSNYSASFPPYLAFDRNINNAWLWGPIGTTNNYIGYKFPSTRKVYAMKATFAREGNPVNATVKIQGSVNGIDNYVDLATFDTSSFVIGQYNVITVLIDNPSNYLSYRLFSSTAMLQSEGLGFTPKDIQFYGRASSDVLIPLVPIMTSNTTPSGECISDDMVSPYQAFDGDNSTFSNTPSGVTTGSLIYDFKREVNVNASYIDGTWSSSYSVYGSNDNENWTELSTNLLAASIVYFNNTDKYRYYKILVTGTTGTYVRIYTAQFYQKQAQTNIIHSAANDTIYMMNNGTQVPLCTTNSDGDGILDFTQFTDGTYTLYSSVAKDPTNLSNDYSKSVRITKTSYGCTTEAYLMPDTIRTLYWYGYEDNELEDMSTANGWTPPTSGTFLWISPTRSTNKINIYCSANNRVSGIARKVKKAANYQKIVYQSVQTNSPSWYYVSNTTKAWNSEISSWGNPITISSTLAFESKATGTSSNCYIGLATTTGARSTDIYAWWYE